MFVFFGGPFALILLFLLLSLQETEDRPVFRKLPGGFPKAKKIVYDWEPDIAAARREPKSFWSWLRG